MWLMVCGLGAVGLLGWYKLALPLYRMLVIHDDVSGENSYQSGPSQAEPANIDPLQATRDLQKLGEVVWNHGGSPAPAPSNPPPVTVEAERETILKSTPN